MQVNETEGDVRDQVELKPDRPKDIQVEINPEVRPSHNKSTEGDHLGSFALHVIEEFGDLW